jgi:hypothetical protein
MPTIPGSRWQLIAAGILLAAWVILLAWIAYSG